MIRALLLAALLLPALAAFPLCAGADASGPDFYRVVGVEPFDVLNIRQGPSPDEAKVGEIPHNGRHVRNLGESREIPGAIWVKIEYDGVQGWVNSRYLEEDGGDFQ